MTDGARMRFSPAIIAGRDLSRYTGAMYILLSLLLAARPSPTPDGKNWKVEAPHGPSETVRFKTDEGTWLHVDVHPDGQRLVFSLLGDLYLLPIAGGTASRITS